MGHLVKDRPRRLNRRFLHRVELNSQTRFSRTETQQTQALPARRR